MCERKYLFASQSLSTFVPILYLSLFSSVSVLWGWIYHCIHELAKDTQTIIVYRQKPALSQCNKQKYHSEWSIELKCIKWIRQTVIRNTSEQKYQIFQFFFSFSFPTILIAMSNYWIYCHSKIATWRHFVSYYPGLADRESANIQL